MNQSDNTGENDRPDKGWASGPDSNSVHDPTQSIPPAPAGGPGGEEGRPYPTSGQTPYSSSQPSYQPDQGSRNQDQAYLGQSAPQSQAAPSQYDRQPTDPAWSRTSDQENPSYQSGSYPTQSTYQYQPNMGTQPPVANNRYRSQDSYQEQPYGQDPPAYQRQDPYGQQPGYQGGPGYQQPGYQGQNPGPQIPQEPIYPGGAPYAYNGIPPIKAPWYGIDFLNACKRYFIKFSIFTGRASRSEFWWAFLMTFLIQAAASAIGYSFSDRIGQGLVGLVDLILLIPNLAIATRRLHDTNMSGLWLLLPWGCMILGTGIIASGFFAFLGNSFGTGGALLIFGWMVAIAGIIAEIIFMVRPSDPRGRRYDR